MADDLPDISQDLDAPLPTMPPDSAMVPYRMARTEPGGQPVVTTGWGPRARPPIQPPAGFGGGVGMPDLDRIYQAAFSKLPVDQAVKAVEAATRYMGQRQYQRDLANGVDAITAFQKAAPLMFHQATGIPETFEAQTARAKMNAPTIHAAAGGLYRVPATGPAQTLVPPKPAAPSIHVNNTTGEVIQTGPEGVKVLREGTAKPQKREPPTEEEKDAYKQLDEARKDMAKLVAKPLPKNSTAKQKKDYQDSMDDATERMRDARVTISKLNPQVQQPTTAAPKVKEVVRLTKDGKKAVFDADTKKFIRYAE